MLTIKKNIFKIGKIEDFIRKRGNKILKRITNRVKIK